ncbi:MULTISPECIES: hypothetical protein [unclassified Mameliella]|uniref:hypothetical protein n=1 Tax=unclassified Mameliella TaxID=2630630 RepID=UPI00273F10A7|nr:MULTISPECIES: hypothetical protein [unclassified Mameliella]
MTNLPAAMTATIPTPTPQHAASLSPQELADHRQKIASEVEVVLSAYFQPNEGADIRAAQLAWWCDELQDWTREQVVFALRQWNRANPRRRPTPGDISGLLKEIRGRKEAERMRATAPPPEPEKERVSKEQAEAILKDAGFNVRRFPKVGEGAE